MNEIDLIINAANEGDAKQKLAETILEYANEFMDSKELYMNAPNRKGHIIYVEKALALKVADRISEEIKIVGQMRNSHLRYWYVDGELNSSCWMAHGIVTGHPKLEDATFIHTSTINNILIDKENGEAVIKTRNTEYHCPLEYCRWDEQEEHPDSIPEYEWIKENFENKIHYPSIEDEKVLLVISNFNEYYFNSLYYKPNAAGEKLSYKGVPHIGMFQDSFLIRSEDSSIDLRYFPHFENIEFYLEHTDGKRFYIQNIGDCTLYARTSKGYIKLNPGERKEVSEDNAEAEEPVLHMGDLYSALIIDE